MREADDPPVAWSEGISWSLHASLFTHHSASPKAACNSSSARSPPAELGRGGTSQPPGRSAEVFDSAPRCRCSPSEEGLVPSHQVGTHSSLRLQVADRNDRAASSLIPLPSSADSFHSTYLFRGRCNDCRR